MSALSPGLAQGAFDLLAIVGRQRLQAPQVAETFTRLGGVGGSAALSLAQGLNWLEVDEGGYLGLSAAGRAVLSSGAYRERLRRAILDFAEAMSPPWLQDALGGRARVLAFAGAAVAQAFAEAEVAEGDSEDVVGFWDTLAALGRGLRDDRLLAIGRRAERLTLRFEEARTGTRPRWVALDSNEEGYDILSVVEAGASDPLLIEVKATTMRTGGLLHLTRNEWDCARDAADHRFHLWDLSSPDNVRMAEVGVGDLAGHIAPDVGQGTWREMCVPFSVFEDRFVPTPLTGG